MRKLLVFLLALVSATALGLYLKQDVGYVLISYKSWVIELSLFFAIVIIILSLFLLKMLIHFVKSIFNLPVRSFNWYKHRMQNKVYIETSKGLLKLAEGNYKQSFYYLIKSVSSQKKPLINYLTAAKAAQELNDIKNRDYCLRKAFECSPKSGLSIGLMQATLQNDNHEYEAALATLKDLKHTYGVNKAVLKKLLVVYVNLKDWYKVIKLAPDLYRYKIYADQEILDYEILAAQNYFARNSAEPEVVFNQELSKNARNNYKVLIAYVHNIINKEHEEKNLDIAISLIEKALSYNASKHTHCPEAHKELLNLFGDIACNEDHFRKLEKQLKDNTFNIELLFALGKLAIKLNQLEKAYQYLNQAKKLSSDNTKHLAIDHHLAYVLLQQGQQQQGLELFCSSF